MYILIFHELLMCYIKFNNYLTNSEYAVMSLYNNRICIIVICATELAVMRKISPI